MTSSLTHMFAGALRHNAAARVAAALADPGPYVPPPLSWQGQCPCGPHDATWTQYPEMAAKPTCGEGR